MTKLTEQKKIRFTQDESEFLSQQENASELIRTLLEEYRSGGNTLYKQLTHIEQQINEQKVVLVNLELKREQLRHQVEEMETKKSLRPEGYQDCVERLLNMDTVTTKDIGYQADLLGVDVLLFKRWLFDDDFFDKRLS